MMKMHRMAAILAAVSVTAALSACGGGSGKAETTAAATTAAQTTEASTTAAAEAKVIRPMPGAYTMDDLSDCTVIAQFTADDFDWDKNCVYAMIYDETLYDMADAAGLKVGDVIETGDGDLEVKTIREADFGKVINEGQADEITFQPQDGGVWQLVGLDDIRDMKLLGQAQLTLSENVVLHDRTDDPGKTVDIAAKDMKSYLNGLKDYEKDFTQFDTTVLIENGKVTEITRIWRP